MSVIICEGCDKFVDTDYERSFYHKKTADSFCENCVENLSDEELEENYYE